MIEDGRIAPQNGRQTEIWVAGGWFDKNWQVDDSLVILGKPDVREKAQVLHAPKPDFAIDPKILASYAGSYEIRPGAVAKIWVDGRKLMVQPGPQNPVELVPVTDTEFVILEGPVKVVFEKDAAGKVLLLRAWQNGQVFDSKKIE